MTSYILVLGDVAIKSDRHVLNFLTVIRAICRGRSFHQHQNAP